MTELLVQQEEGGVLDPLYLYTGTGTESTIS